MATVKIPAWSFSSIKTFEQCPKKYYHLKVAKDFQEDQNVEHLTYGKLFHEAAEFYIRDNTPLPPEFGFAKSALDNLKNRPGRKLCEYEMGLTANLEPCGFKDPNVWWRGIADLIIIEDDGTARVLDYKTGKSAKYADTGQLELMALAVFKHFPEVKRVKAGLLFVIAKAFPKASYRREEEPILWGKWLADYGKMKRAYETGVWNPKTSGLCKKHCVVLSCPHNGRS
jgi:CRISPR/Cas system-associated exonuclease Cas4 (RecB family)